MKNIYVLEIQSTYTDTYDNTEQVATVLTSAFGTEPLLEKYCLHHLKMLKKADAFKYRLEDEFIITEFTPDGKRIRQKVIKFKHYGAKDAAK